MPKSTWQSLLDVASGKPNHTRQTRYEHWVVFHRWIAKPLRDQAAEMRAYLTAARIRVPFHRDHWAHLIPDGEPEIYAELFLDDLESLIRVLTSSISYSAAAPDTSQRGPVTPVRSTTGTLSALQAITSDTTRAGY